MFFDGWDSILRVVAVGVLAYAGLVLLLRISGNRTLSKMNSFDLVVTVAFGSTLSTIIVNKNVSLATGLAALALLVLLQYVITWTSVRVRLFNAAVKTQATLLVRDGALLHDAMRRVRITEDEIRSAVRKQGHGSLDPIAAVVLETDGSLAVIATDKAGDRAALSGLD